MICHEPIHSSIELHADTNRDTLRVQIRIYHYYYMCLCHKKKVMFAVWALLFNPVKNLSSGFVYIQLFLIYYYYAYVYYI